MGHGRVWCDLGNRARVRNQAKVKLHGWTVMTAAFERQLACLVEDAREASQHYDLYKQIREAISIEEKIIKMNRAPAFWSLTLNAHLNSCRLGLCRVYDKTRGSINIDGWLREHRKLLLDKALEPEIEERHHMSSPVTASTIDSDLALTNEKNELVKKLSAQRNKAIIHTDRLEAEGLTSVFERFPLTYSNYEELIQRADTILNRYSVLYSGAAYQLSVAGRSDVQRVLC